MAIFHIPFFRRLLDGTEYMHYAGRQCEKKLCNLLIKPPKMLFAFLRYVDMLNLVSSLCLVPHLTVV